ncbi:uncharacterized protein LOC141696348 [Apium graveolens]|uniref:uncharacterized protein LOC141696348 n=1 Tax=Apium graveolens TaxID=4045 RepID=UPI003D7C1033
MDFVTHLPRTFKKNDVIWVVIDRLTKSAHFLPIRETTHVHELTEIFQRDIVRLHGVPVSIVSDRDTSWHASIGMPPFEDLYGRRCRAPSCWDEVGERVIEGPELVRITNEKVEKVKESLKEARSRQKSYADQHRKFGGFEPVLRGYKYHPLHVVQYPLHKIREDLSCEEEAEAILSREERVLRKNTIPFVKMSMRPCDLCTLPDSYSL